VSKGHKRGQRSPVVGKEIPRKLDARECRGNEASFSVFGEKPKPLASMEHRRASNVLSRDSNSENKKLSAALLPRNCGPNPFVEIIKRHLREHLRHCDRAGQLEATCED